MISLYRFALVPMFAITFAGIAACGAAPEDVSANPSATSADNADDETADDTDDTGSTAAAATSTASATQWKTVYKDYFAAGAIGHCGMAGCHKTARAGFKCGSSAKTCLKGLITAGLVDMSDPASSELGGSSTPLAWYGHGGEMPADTGAVNTPAAKAVTAWLKAGAKP